MKDFLIAEIKQNMLNELNNAQMQKLSEVLEHCLYNVEIIQHKEVSNKITKTNEELLAIFLSAKRVEGCSEKTLRYYKASIAKMFSLLHKYSLQITTDDLRQYLADYQKINQCSKTNIDNIRRILSSFFRGSKMKIISSKVLCVAFTKLKRIKP